MKSGFIAILGRPNVGKSSLMNALIGEKVSIVSPKAQTTRNRVTGILTTDEYQMIFSDTPGIHAARSVLGEYMNACVDFSVVDADAVVVVFDGSKRVDNADIALLERHLKRKPPVYLVLNKTDLTSYEKLYPVLSRFAKYTEPEDGRAAVKEIIPLCARTGHNVEILKNFLVSELKDGVLYYPEDQITDRSERFTISELVREKALYYLNDEIPHGIGVSVASMSYDEKGTAHISLEIFVERDSHKKIVIGDEGATLKKIMTESRKDIERMLDAKAYIETFVKVRKDWRNRKNIMADIGYDIKGEK